MCTDCAQVSGENASKVSAFGLLACHIHSIWWTVVRQKVQLITLYNARDIYVPHCPKILLCFHGEATTLAMIAYTTVW